MDIDNIISDELNHLYRAESESEYDSDEEYSEDSESDSDNDHIPAHHVNAIIDQRIEAEINRILPDEFKLLRQKGLCFLCKEGHHFARECPMRKHKHGKSKFKKRQTGRRFGRNGKANNNKKRLIHRVNNLNQDDTDFESSDSEAENDRRSNFRRRD